MIDSHTGNEWRAFSFNIQCREEATTFVHGDLPIPGGRIFATDYGLPAAADRMWGDGTADASPLILAQIILTVCLLYNDVAGGFAVSAARRITMSSGAKQTEQPFPVPGPNDPPVDLSREEAAYAREEERLVRDHLGWVALIHDDEVVGAFPTADEAILEGYRRFGDARMVFKEIRDPHEPPDFISFVDINHPSIKRLD